MNNQRISYLDFMKGVCIILLVSFHISPQYKLHQTFLMPIFFFLSGLNFKTYESWREFLKKKINSLLVPFAFFLTLGAVYQFLRDLLENHFNLQPALGNLLINPINYNTPVWFLLVLFEIFIIYYLLNRFARSIIPLILSCVLGVFGYLLIVHDIRLLFYFELSLVSIPFFALGVEVRKLGFVLRQPHCLFTALLFIITVVWVAVDTPIINMIAHTFPNPLLLYGMTSMVILSSFFLSQYVKTEIFFVSYVGRYSLIVLGTHYFAIGPLKAILGIILSQPFHQYLAVLVITLLIELPIIWACKKYIPRLVAIKPLL